VIRTHLYWGYKLSRAEELLKVTAVCPTVCNLSCEREDVTLDPHLPRMQGTSEGEERARADRALTKTYSFTSLDSAFWRAEGTWIADTSVRPWVIGLLPL
jgi:hypothetical protein